MPEHPARNLAHWFDTCAPGLVLYARQWLPRAEAEDAVQEVFVRLMAQPREPANVKGWLFVATRNAAIAAARSDRRRVRREQTAAEQSAEGRQTLFEHRLHDLIDAAVAEAALAALPAPQREVVTLRIWGGMTLAEVSQVTGLAVSTVHDHYRAGLARLKESMHARSQPRTAMEAS